MVEVAGSVTTKIARAKVRSVAEYLKMAAQFEALAAAATVEVLKKRYDDIAACYRLLAKDRERLIATGALQDDQQINVRPLPSK
jgi:hypothetical protein